MLVDGRHPNVQRKQILLCIHVTHITIGLRVDLPTIIKNQNMLKTKIFSIILMQDHVSQTHDVCDMIKMVLDLRIA